MQSLGPEMEESPAQSNVAQHQKFIYSKSHVSVARNKVKKQTGTHVSSPQQPLPQGKTAAGMANPALSLQSKLAFLHQRMPMSLLCQLGPSEISLVYDQFSKGEENGKTFTERNY